MKTEIVATEHIYTFDLYLTKAQVDIAIDICKGTTWSSWKKMVVLGYIEDLILDRFFDISAYFSLRDSNFLDDGAYIQIEVYTDEADSLDKATEIINEIGEYLDGELGE